MGSLFKSIHIHPENIIRLDVWASEHHPKAKERGKATAKGHAEVALLDRAEAQGFMPIGVILPFTQNGQGGSGTGTSPDKKNPTQGDTPGGSIIREKGESAGWDHEVAGSSGILNGRGGEIRTHDPLLPKRETLVEVSQRKGRGTVAKLIT